MKSLALALALTLSPGGDTRTDNAQSGRMRFNASSPTRHTAMGSLHQQYSWILSRGKLSSGSKDRQRMEPGKKDHHVSGHADDAGRGALGRADKRKPSQPALELWTQCQRARMEKHFSLAANERLFVMSMTFHQGMHRCTC